MPDYSKLKWHDGVPEELEAGMVIETSDYGYKLLGDLTDFAEYGCAQCDRAEDDKILRWAWLDGCER
jgi:hypothetical protein